MPIHRAAQQQLEHQGEQQHAADAQERGLALPVLLAQVLCQVVPLHQERDILALERGLHVDLRAGRRGRGAASFVLRALPGAGRPCGAAAQRAVPPSPQSDLPQVAAQRLP